MVPQNHTKRQVEHSSKNFSVYSTSIDHSLDGTSKITHKASTNLTTCQLSQMNGVVRIVYLVLAISNTSSRVNVCVKQQPNDILTSAVALSFPHELVLANTTK